MDTMKLARLSFDKNVGTGDRLVRFIFGVAMIAGGWLLGLPTWQSAAMSVAGLMSLSTAVLSKCSVYYLLGYSTCPVSGESLRARSR
jgi:hypothetical protein